MREEDKRLVDSVLAGDAQATARFDRQLDSLVRAVAVGAEARYRFPVETDELRQTVLLLLREDDWRVLRGWAGRSGLRSWLQTITARHCARLMQRRVEQRRREVALQDSAEVAVEVDAAARLDRRRQLDALQALLAEMTPEDRAFFRLVFEQEAATTVVAAALGVTPDAVRMRKMRMLRRLRSGLEKSGVTFGADAGTVSRKG